MKVSARISFVVLLLVAAMLAQSYRRKIVLRGGGPQVAANIVLFAFKPGVHPSKAYIQREFGAALDAAKIRPVGGAGAWMLRSRSRDVDQLIAALKSHSDIAYAEPDPVYHTMSSGVVPNDPNYPEEWGLNNTGQSVDGLSGTAGSDIHAQQAWGISTGSNSIVVGVVDSGIDYTIPDMIPNLWTASQPFNVTLGGYTTNCPAGTHGFSAVSGYSGCDPYDQDVAGHGTWVSSIMGAAGNNNSGYVGVNWTTSIMSLRAASPSGDGFNGTFYGDDAASAIEAGIQIKQELGAAANLRVLNLSFGTTPTGSGYSQTMYNEIQRAEQNDILVVAASGDEAADGSDYPAAYGLPNELSVGGSNLSDAQTSDTNWGPSVNLSAPGEYIWGWTMGGHSERGDGASASAAFVSGVAALVLSHCPLDTVGLRATLLGTVDTPPGLYGSNSTNGRVDAYSAIASCTGTAAQASVSISGTGCLGGSAACGWGSQNVPPSGMATLTIDGNTFSYSWSAALDTSVTIANALAAKINAGTEYSAQVSSSGDSNATIVLTARALGPYPNNYQYSTDLTDTCVSSPPYSQCASNPFWMSGAGNFTGGHS